MRRRRHRLQVSTFPFLAVLLCAMGSLILLLLVLDRRAKAVARAKLQEAADRTALADKDDADARRQDWDRRRQALHADLLGQQRELQARLAALRGQIEQAAASYQAATAKVRSNNEQLQAEQARVARADQELRGRHAELAKAGEKGEGAKAELVRLTGQLEQLEATLRELKADRERQKHTYSVVPYRGRRGEDRAPLYVECAPTGLVFHPDRRAFRAPLLPGEVRGEVERRIARQRSVLIAAGRQPDRVPYLLFLVRPDGIGAYYQAMDALKALDLDFGYELIDADWVLDFPENDESVKPQPWMAGAPVAAGSPGAGPRPAPGSLAQVRPVGVDFGPDHPPGGPEGPGGLPLGMRPAPAGGVPGSPGPAPAPGLSVVPPPAIGESARAVSPSEAIGVPQGPPSQAPQGGQLSPAGASVAPGVPGVTVPAGPAGSPAQMGNGTPGDKFPLGGGSPGPKIAPVEGARFGPAGGPPAGGNPGMPSAGGTAVAPAPAAPVAPQPRLLGAPPAADTQGGAGGSPQPAGAPPEESPERAPRRGPIDPLPVPVRQSRQRPLRPAWIGGNRDYNILVECAANSVIVYPQRLRIGADSLALGKGGDAQLMQAVQQMIDRRQGTVRQGEWPYRPYVRLLVRPDGLLTLHQAYPVLQRLRVPMTRQNIEADDDVSELEY